MTTQIVNENGDELPVRSVFRPHPLRDWANDMSTDGSLSAYSQAGPFVAQGTVTGRVSSSRPNMETVSPRGPHNHAKLKKALKLALEELKVAMTRSTALGETPVFSVARWKDVTNKLKQIALAAAEPHAHTNVATMGDAAWAMLLEARQNQYETTTSERAFEEIIGRMHPGAYAVTAIPHSEKYVMSGLDHEIRKAGAELIPLYSKMLRLVRPEYLRTMGEPAHRVYMGLLLFLIIVKALQEIYKENPELPNWMQFRGLDIAAKLAEAAPSSGVSVLLVEHLLKNWFNGFVPRMIHGIVAADPSRPTRDQDDTRPEWLCVRMWFAQSVAVEMLNLCGSNHREIQAHTIQAVQQADTLFTGGRCPYQPSAGYRGHYQQLNGAYGPRWPEDMLNNVIRAEIPAPAFWHSNLEEIGLPTAYIGLAARFVEHLWDLGVTPREALETCSDWPQVGEVWGNPDEPVNWMYMHSVNPDGKLVYSSFAIDEFAAVGEIRPKELFEQEGMVRIYPVVLVQGKQTTVAKRTVRLRVNTNTLQVNEAAE